MPAIFQQGSLYILLASLLVGTLWRGGYSSDPQNLLPAWVFIALLLSSGAWELIVTFALKQKRSLTSPAWLLFIAFTLFSMASIAWSVSANDTIRESLLILGYAMVLFTVRGQLLRSGWQALNLSTSWFVYVAAFASAWGVISYLFRISPYSTSLDNLYRAGATFEYSNALSCFCLMALPLVFATMVREKPGDRPLNIVTGILVTSAVLVSFSRLGMVLLAAMSVLFLVFYWRRGMVLSIMVSIGLGVVAAIVAMITEEAGLPVIGLVSIAALLVIGYLAQMLIGSIKERRILVGGVFVLGAAGALATVLALSFSERVRDIITSRYGTEISFSSLFPHRLDTYRGAIDAFKAKPAVGSGLGTFPKVYEGYAFASYTKFAHNVVLQMAVDTGIAGAVLFVLFLVYAAGLTIWRLLGRSDLLLRSLAVSSVVFLLYNMFDWEWYIPALTAWFMVVVACMETGVSIKDLKEPEYDDDNQGRAGTKATKAMPQQHPKKKRAKRKRSGKSSSR